MLGYLWIWAFFLYSSVLIVELINFFCKISLFS
nr:MAG TPA: hypothetical protein [Caudoviricetes sp.]